MEDGVMSIAHKGVGKDTLTEVPAAPKHLSAEGKKAYKSMGNLLCKSDRLKTYMLPTLEIFSEAYSQWVYACHEINRLNKEALGMGYIQTFIRTGARQISPEITVRGMAADDMLKCSKLFGLDPKSEKELTTAVKTGQLDLFAAVGKALAGG